MILYMNLKKKNNGNVSHLEENNNQEQIPYDVPSPLQGNLSEIEQSLS